MTASPALREDVTTGPLLSASDVRTFTAIRRLLELGDDVWIVVTGISMRPTLEPGDRVLLTSAKGERVAGRIVLADVDGRPVLHRVITQRAGVLMTAGDGCARADPPITRGAVIARAEAVCSAGGVAALGFTTRFGVIALARYGSLEARALALRFWRRIRYRLPTRLWIWSGE